VIANGDVSFTTAGFRPCLVDGSRKALFHRWADVDVLTLVNVDTKDVDGARVIFVSEPGKVEVAGETVAIVEYEDGTVDRVSPHRIRFLDRFVLEYAFPE